jgi:hypothetical protein
MVEAWLYKESKEDGRLPHKYTPSLRVSLAELKDLRIMHWKHDPNTQMDKIDYLADQFDFVHREIVVLLDQRLKFQKTNSLITKNRLFLLLQSSLKSY